MRATSSRGRERRRAAEVAEAHLFKAWEHLMRGDHVGTEAELAAAERAVRRGDGD